MRSALWSNNQFRFCGGIRWAWYELRPCGGIRWAWYELRPCGGIKWAWYEFRPCGDRSSLGAQHQLRPCDDRSSLGAQHQLRPDPLVKLFLRDKTQFNRGLFQCEAFLVCIPRDLACIVVANVRAESCDKH